MKEKQEVDININIVVEDNRTPSHAHRNADSAKLKTSLSVPQLAFLFRLLFELDVFKTSNQTEILKFISDNFETSNSKDISINSLRSKYYTVDEATRQSVKEFATRLIQRIDQTA